MSRLSITGSVGWSVALGIGGLTEVWRRRVKARVTIQGGDREERGGWCRREGEVESAASVSE